MNKILYPSTALILSVAALTSCSTSNGSSSKKNVEQNQSAVEQNKEKSSDYIVDISDDFETGIDLKETRQTLSPEESDFRNLKWGMSKDEVAYAQGNGYRDTDDNTMYYTRVREEEYPADAEYKFSDNKLVQGTFYITENKSDTAVTIDDYHTLVDSLAQRFGEPNIADKTFFDESVKTDDTSKHTALILENKLQYRTGWMLEDTELRVVLFAKDSKLCIGLQYKEADAKIPQ